MADTGQRFATRLNSFRSKDGGTESAEQAVRAVAKVPGVSVTAQLEGMAMQESLKRAAAVGALAVSRPGSAAGLITRRDIDKFLGA